MKKSMVLLAAMAVSTLALATQPGNNGNGNGGCGVGQQTNGCGGQGGAGGAGGQGGSATGIGIAGASANAAAIAAQQQGQIQGQSQSSRNSNSVRSSNANTTTSMGGNSYASSGGNVITTSQEGAKINVQVEGAKGDVTYYQAQERNPVSTAYAAPLTSAPEACMGSSSGGAQGANFGFTLGTTWQSAACERRMNARALQSTGNQLAAVALLCQDDSIRQAMEDAGAACPSKSRKGAAMDAYPVAGSAGVEPKESKVDVSYVDPIIRSRLGLPPLK